MAELFIPKPLDLLTPALQIKQFQQQGQFREQQLGQGQQRLDLLRKNLSFRREQEGAQQKQQQFKNNLDLIGKLTAIDPELAIPFAEKTFGEQTGIDFSAYKTKGAEFKKDFQAFQDALEKVNQGIEPPESIQGILDSMRLKHPRRTEPFVDVLGDIQERITPEEGKNISVNLRDFETVSGIDSSLRGTQEYRDALKSYRKTFEGRNQLVGTTPEGQIVTFNTIDSSIETKDAPAILPKTKKIVSGEIAGQIATMDSLVSGIADIRRISLANPELIGPAVGRWNKLKSRFVDNQDFVELDRNVESMITLAYALSGKQISEREMRMLKTAILPSVTMPGANFQTALDFAEKWLTVNRDNRIGRLEEFGFFTGKQQGRETIPSPTKRKPLSSFVGE